MRHPPEITNLLRALDELNDAAAANIERAEEIGRRVEQIRRDLEAGVTLPEIVAEEPRPRIVELVTASIVALEGFGSELRLREAEALRSEDFTLQEIADLFGVTRQRISAILSAGR